MSSELGRKSKKSKQSSSKSRKKSKKPEILVDENLMVPDDSVLGSAMLTESDENRKRKPKK